MYGFVFSRNFFSHTPTSWNQRQIFNAFLTELNDVQNFLSVSLFNPDNVRCFPTQVLSTIHA